MRRFFGGLAMLLLAGCAAAADIKPGQVRGIDDRGYVKTTEGFALAVTGCNEVWQPRRNSATINARGRPLQGRGREFDPPPAYHQPSSSRIGSTLAAMMPTGAT